MLQIVKHPTEAGTHLLEEGDVLRRKRSWCIGIDVENCYDSALAVLDWHDDLAVRARTAGDVFGPCMDVGDVLRFSGAGRSAADPPLKRDGKATVPALIRSDLEHTGLRCAVEPRPVEMIEPVVELAHHRGHGRNPVGFTFKQAFDSVRNFLVHGHGALNGVFERLNDAMKEQRTLLACFPPAASPCD